MIVGADSPAELLTSIAWVLFGLALLIAATVLTPKVKHLVAELKGVKLTMDTQVVPEMKAVKAQSDKQAETLEQVAYATNHSKLGEPTLVQRVMGVEVGVAQLSAQLHEHTRDETKWRDVLVAKIGVDMRMAIAEQTVSEHPARQ